MTVCRQRFPGRTDLGGGHWTHCFLYGEGERVEGKPDQERAGQAGK